MYVLNFLFLLTVLSSGNWRYNINCLVGQSANPWNKRRNYLVIRVPTSYRLRLMGFADFKENVGIGTNDISSASLILGIMISILHTKKQLNKIGPLFA